MKTGVELITEERQRQIEKEGWTADHDEQHCFGTLALAGACYAINHYSEANHLSAYYHNWAYDHWPWDDKWWKPSKDPIRDLTKAGALIAAEIDRLQRQGKS
jgi:hypothetical protein